MSKLSQLKQQAYQAAKKRDWDTAVSIYSDILELDKNNPTLINEMGDLYLKANDTQRAIKHFLNAASKYRSTGLLNNAVAIYKKILRFDTQNLNAHWYLAETRAGQGLMVEGQQHGLLFLEHSEKVSGDIKEIFLKRCSHLLELYPEAGSILEHLLQVFRMWDMPLETAKVRCLLACQVWDTGDEDAARQAVADTVEKTPEICNYGEYNRWMQRTGCAPEPETAAHTDFDSVALDVPASDAPAETPDEISVETPAETPVEIPVETPVETPAAAKVPETPAPETPVTTESTAPPAPAAEAVPDSPTADWGEMTFGNDAPSGDEASAEKVPAAEIETPPPAPKPAAETPAVEKDNDGCIDLSDDSDLSFDDLLSQAADGLADAVADEKTAPEPDNEDAGAPAAADTAKVDLLAEILADDSAPAANASNQLETITKEIGAQVGGAEGSDDPASLYEMGLVYLEMGMFEQACGSFRQAAEDSTYTVRAHEMWGITLMRGNRADEAIEVLAKAQALTEDGTRESLGILYHLARAHEQADQEGIALGIYEQIHDQDRSFLDVGKRLAQLSTA